MLFTAAAAAVQCTKCWPARRDIVHAEASAVHHPSRDSHQLTIANRCTSGLTQWDHRCRRQQYQAPGNECGLHQLTLRRCCTLAAHDGDWLLDAGPQKQRLGISCRARDAVLDITGPPSQCAQAQLATGHRMQDDRCRQLDPGCRAHPRPA